MVAHAGVSHAAVVVMVHWGKTASCLLAGGSLGYLLADPSSSLVSLPLAGIGSAVFLLFQYPTAKDRTESQLREEIAQGESRFGALAQAAGAVVWRSSAAGEIDTPQPQWCEFTGQSFEESAGHSWMDAIHPGDRERVSRQWPVAVAKHAVYQAELRLRDKRGGYRDVVLRAAPVLGDGGRVQEWVGALADVTEERTVQRALAEQERHHRRVLDALETFVTVLSPEGNVVSTNSTALTAAAIGIEDVQGLPFWDCYWWNWSPRVQEELRAHVARAAAGEASRYDAEIRIAQGELTTVEFVIAPMRDGQDRVAFLVATGVDISDRRRTEMTLNEREQFYRQLIESMPLLTWTCTPDGTCDFISSRWHKYAGQVVDPGCLFTNMEHVHPDDRDDLRRCWEQGLESGRAFQAEIRLRRDDGVYHWFACYVTPIRSPRGEVIKWCGTSIDIDDRKQMEEALRDSETRLRTLNSSLERRVKERTRELVERSDQLRALALDLSETEARERKRLAQVLHDHFQQLISAAKLKAGLLRRRTTDDAHVQSLRQIESLLEEAINASRTLATQLSPPVLHDAGLVAALGWLVRRMETDHQLVVELKVEGECEPDNEQVRVIIFECIREILFNVRKHAGVDNATLTLRLLPENLLVVEVEDKGKGFQPIKLERQKAADMSFGLFSIRERMSLIGGLLKIESEPGKGTRVSLSVPCVPHAAKEAATSVSSPLAAASGRTLPSSTTLRVLVADDHALFREGLVGLLSQEPYLEVIGQAADGEEAINMVRELRPDLLIVDVSMPKASGVQVTATVTKEQPGTRVIGLSMHEQEDMARSMRDAGAVAYFAKSGAPEETLLALLRSWVAPAPAPVL